ncbi:MAG: pseudaminic acid synthase [Chitinophagales bacterium]
MQIKDKKIGIDHPTYIIAELSGNHNQDFDLAVKTVYAMKEAGADAVKLQTYTADTITLDSEKPDFKTRADSLWAGQKLHDLYKVAYTPWEWQPKLKQLANDLGMHCFSSPFDPTSVDFLEKMNVPAYKIASFEITDIPLIKYVASKGKPVIMSTGIADLSDIELAIAACHSVGNHQIALLKCTSAYPTPLEDAHLQNIPFLASKYNTIVGLSDHTLGTIVPITAVALGARIVEKHFILDRNLGGVDSAFSLDATEFKEMVDSIRNVEKALGQKDYFLPEKSKRAKVSARSLYISQDMKKGDVFTLDNVRSVRPAYGLHPQYLEQVLGKKVTEDVDAATALSWELVQG